MRKSDFGTRKVPRRRAQRAELFQMDKNFNNDFVAKTNDVADIIREKLLSSVSSGWMGSDLIFHVALQKRSRSLAKSTAADRASATGQASSNRLPDRHLVILKKKDADNAIYLLQTFLRDGEIEVKKSFAMSFVRAIDFGADVNELLLTFDEEEYSAFFLHTGDRDETTWIIVQLHKSCVGTTISIGYSIDVDALDFMISTNGTLTKFPLLQKLVKANSSLLGTVFYDEEIEAEQLLDELHWSSTAGAHVDLQETLSRQATTLHTEIIDFLLQWEELDSSSADSPVQVNMGDINPLARGFSLGLNQNNNSNRTQKQQSALGDAVGRMRDTREVLDALEQVDSELEGVDKWLGDQIERLSAIQSNLRTIEDESSGLETTWQNLSRAQEIIRHIVDGYSIDEASEETLLQADSIISKILQPSSSLDDQFDTELEPIIAAVALLKKALGLKLNDHATIKMTSMQWRQLQSITAISSQKQKLVQLADAFCNSFSQTALGLFDLLLKHRAICEGSAVQTKTSTADSNKKLGFASKHFDYAAVLENIFAALVKESAVTSNSSNNSNSNNNNSIFAMLDSTNNMLLITRRPSHNPILRVQQRYHGVLYKFSPLLQALEDLAENFRLPVCEAYVRSTRDRFYSPLLKTCLKDLHSLHSSRLPSVTLSSIARYRLGEPYTPLIRFSAAPVPVSAPAVGANAGIGMGARAGLTSWMGFRLVLMMVSPIIEAEEVFLQDLFRLEELRYEMRPHSDPKRATKLHEEHIAALLSSSRLGDITETIFEGIVGRLESAAFSSGAGGGTGTGGGGSVGGEVDGIEAIALLRVLNHFAEDYARGFIRELRAKEIEAREKEQAKEAKEKERDTPASGEASVGTAPSSGTALYTKRGFERKKKAPGPATSRVLGSVNDRDVSMDPNHTNAAVTAAGSRMPDGTLIRPRYSYFLQGVLAQLRVSVVQRIGNYCSEQTHWIRSQKGDPKQASVFPPFARFPSLVLQILEITGGQSYDCVEDLIYKLATELFNWLMGFARQNEKYTDKIKITNFTFFVRSMQPLGIPILDHFVAYASQQISESAVRYVNWMCSYEFPSMSVLASRMDGVGNRVNEEELSLYIRRKDVLNVVKELNKKTLEAAVSNLRKRLEKHYRSEYDSELNLVRDMWLKISDRVLTILTRLEDAASASYQLSLDVGPSIAQAMFQKHAV